ncbi:S-formylglutathione hydrolase-like [Lingula anatina]|uniref:S-formylglutathione hydrolase n=1 Tax=Lingula anatina TaxID=7574 RepID=A0A1S3HTT3_LINAN|nr:S-formylglutathione hydrolase-like [Lingula anatina]|eukprot:XP_013389455.1 S-formylglutathione hydrolase-like [Lingula anatina]
MIVAPDTSPRGCNIEGEDDSYDFGSGAGFYLDASEEKWKTNYRMHSYITKELQQLVNASFPVSGKQSVFGHSMGGHGALICALKNPGMFSSVSAFSPICNPCECAWGQKAFTGYLGSDKEAWKAHDASCLVKSYSGPPLGDILIDQGKDDNFLGQGQLLPDNFVAACAEAKVPVVLRMQEV